MITPGVLDAFQVSVISSGSLFASQTGLWPTERPETDGLSCPEPWPEPWPESLPPERPPSP
ncbi:hypothetical protein [Pseudonocardia sp. ICBG601]|uniref:hypothetical protein n=1 Tax=Pseudonocardia sp. ICBG601 TaxID=2846759 RepID=UPI001CF69362|nr:hypothetical protein [Pseudonocardia sp. ICBG601]